MGKLVLYFPDGSTRDILLAKERTTIGRRADNDVSLPSAAVSAEHAAVVTVLDDSFLEDLGSTNGTFVNEKPVSKHFLRDRDRIDVGREILIYYADDSAAPDELPPGLLHQDTSDVLVPLDAHLAALEDLTRGRSRKSGAAVTEPRPVVAEFDPSSSAPMTGQVATEFDPLAPAKADTEATQRVRARVVEAEPAAADAVASGDTGLPPATIVLRVVDGPDAGREVRLAKPVVTLGRVGVQVAALRRETGTLFLEPLEGDNPPDHNGRPLTPKGAALASGDTFTVAGTTLLLVAF